MTTENRLKENGVSYYRTDQSGAVIVQSDGSAFNEQKDVHWVLKDSALYPTDNELSLIDESTEKLNVGL